MQCSVVRRRHIIRADTRRLEATDRAEGLDRQFELSSREVGRLQIELQRKYNEHQLEKQAILHEKAELRTQNAQFIRHVTDIKNKRNEDFERFKKKNREQEKDIQILEQNLSYEMQARNNRGESSNRQRVPLPVRAATASPGWGLSATEENARMNSQHDGNHNAILEILSEEVEILRHSKQGLENTLACVRQENMGRQQARDVLHAELEDKTGILEERTLAINRMRSELNEERRKSRQALAAIADTNKQFEFVQQECARLQEALSSQRR